MRYRKITFEQMQGTPETLDHALMEVQMPMKKPKSSHAMKQPRLKVPADFLQANFAVAYWCPRCEVFPALVRVVGKPQAGTRSARVVPGDIVCNDCNRPVASKRVRITEIT